MPIRRPAASLPWWSALATFVVLSMVALPGWTADSSSRSEIYRLAGAPEVRVENGVCHIRGAFWRDGFGPVSDRAISINTLQGKQLAVVRTDDRGIYETSLELPDGKGLVLIEGDVYETGFSAGIRRSIEIKRNGGSTQKPKIDHPQIVCVKPSVEVGAIQVEDAQ